MEMLGRKKEQAVLNGLLEASQTGHGGALLLRGELGAGLTALVDYAVGAASEMRIIRIRGVEPEKHLMFAGVQGLCISIMNRVGDLPSPQRGALESALGLVQKGSPDPFLVGLATLTLLSTAAEQRPILCVVDDAQWLDRESAAIIAFAARRLEGERIALVLAVHEPSKAGDPFAGIPEMNVGGLPQDASRELLSAVAAGPLDAAVRERLIAESQGLPLGLVELPAQLTAGQLAGLSGLPAILPAGDRLKKKLLGSSFDELDVPTRALLLLAAIEPDVPASLLWSAAERLGITVEAATPAEAQGLLRVGPRLSFRHPFVRLAIYESATLSERQRAHLAFIDAIGPDTDRRRRTWHRAAAQLTPDEEIATELQELAAGERDRGDYAAAMEWLEHAAALTPDPGQRYGRTLAAVQSAVAAGNLGRASALLDRMCPTPANDLHRVQAERLRAEIALALGQRRDRATTLLRAANALAAVDVRLGRDTYLEAIEASVYSGRFSRDTTLASVAEAARSASQMAQTEAGASDLLLDALSLLVTSGHRLATPIARQATEALCRSDELRWLSLGALLALEFCDDEAFHQLANRQAQLERGVLPHPGLATGLGALERVDDIITGRFEVASPNYPRANHGLEAIPGHSQAPPVGSAELLAAAWRGLPTETREFAETYMREAFVQEAGFRVALAQHALAVLENGLGHYEAAVTVARQACEEPSLYVQTATLPELIEAAVRAGERELAVTAVARFGEVARASGTDWALGLLARGEALVTDSPQAEGLYQAAIERLRSSRAAPQLARAHLVYGEWLRRERRRREAREHLRTARDMFIFMGALSFAERARSELSVTGEHIGPRTVEASQQRLTAQEAQVARLASEGASNAEIAGKLFLSPRTVEYHLHKVFRKLGVSSRVQLALALRQ